jgi:hypothetical protein
LTYVPAESSLHSPPPPRERGEEIEGRGTTHAGQMQAVETTSLERPLPPPPPTPPPPSPTPTMSYAVAVQTNTSKHRRITTRPWDGPCKRCSEATTIYETNHGFYCDPCFRFFYHHTRNNPS